MQMHPTSHLSLRWYSSVINGDEFYGKATDFKFITSDKAKLTEVCEHQGTPNRYFTTGSDVSNHHIIACIRIMVSATSLNIKPGVMDHPIETKMWTALTRNLGTPFQIQ